MSQSTTVTADHLRRLACLYVRQSSLQQVHDHQESTARQYALKRRALALGWAADRIVVIDDDLGLSGASAVERTGFQRVVADVGLGRVGVVMALEVSRLARNSSDWHRLLEILRAERNPHPRRGRALRPGPLQRPTAARAQGHDELMLSSTLVWTCLKRTAAATTVRIVGIALTFVPMSVAAQPALFTDLADTVVARHLQSAGPASEMPLPLRSRAVGISLGLLATARAGVADRGGRLTLNLFDDVVFTATLVRSEQTARGYSLAGTLDADPLSSVVLVVNGDVVAGAIRTLERAYRIRTLSPGVHEIREVDQSQLRLAEPEESSGFIEAGAFSRADDGPAPAGPEDGSVVDVLVAYTPAARAAAGEHDGMEALIDLMVAQTNLAFMYSGVDSRLNLVRTAEVDYVVAEHPDAGCVGCILIDPADGYLDELHTMRDRYAADLVALIVTHPYPYGGEANSWWFRRWPNVDPSRYGFSVTRSDVPAAFTHEIGHNMGLNHDRYAEFHDCCTVRNALHWNSPHPYSYGYVNQRAFEPGAPASSRWRTIMSYGTQCQDAGLQCTSLLRFSNPDLMFNGDPMGVPGDEPSSGPTGPADARRTLNETRAVVANFRIAPCRAGGQDSVAGRIPDFPEQCSV